MVVSTPCSRWGLSIMMLACVCMSASAFSSVQPSSNRVPLSGRPMEQKKLTRCFLDTLTTSIEEEKTPAPKDKNGIDFVVGSVIRVTAENVKAFQVPPKGFGTFDESKAFVPASNTGERGLKNLALPIGLRGVVTKVYDIDEVSANWPIQVKFMPGKNTDEGYDPPVAFLMHFEEHELECV
mmetsp:Transcript_24083/g.33660  ORF Transcript_24083/g.33660 Transcript_24083/m.33660 type:complete len:181 (-) Transcript_24083:118-660(-)